MKLIIENKLVVCLMEFRSGEVYSSMYYTHFLNEGRRVRKISHMELTLLESKLISLVI